MALEVGIIVLLLVINALLAGSETALVSLRQGQVQRLENSGPRGRVTAALVRDSTGFLTTIQIGITVAGFLAAAYGGEKFAARLEPVLEPYLGGAGGPVAFVVVVLVLTYLNLVVGELAPKRMAMQRAEGWSLRAARPLTALQRMARPAVWLLGRSTDLVVRLFGGNPNQQQQDVTEEEIKDLIAAQTEVDPQQRAILSSAFDVRERTLREIVTPRNQVVALPADTLAGDALVALAAGGHTRAPVYGRDIDDVQGIVHVLELVGADDSVGHHLRPAISLPESMLVLDALKQLQVQRQQLAVVYNEHGSTEGVITVEDLLEEIVGEVYDEFDPDLQSIERDAEGAIVLPGAYPMHDLAEIGVELSEGPYTTIAGYALSRIGQIAEGGEAVEADGWRLEVTEVEGRRIARVRLCPLPGTALEHSSHKGHVPSVGATAAAAERRG